MRPGESPPRPLQPRPLPPAGREPRAIPASAPPFVLIGILLCLAGALCIRELLIYHGVVGGDPWVAPIFQWIATLTWGDWLRYVSPVLVVLGLLGVGAALRPRRRTHLRLRGDVPLWLDPTSIARASSARAEELGYVRRAATTASRSRIRITVTIPDAQDGELDPSAAHAPEGPHDTAHDAAAATTPADAPLDDREVTRAVLDAVEPLADELVPRPTVRVRIVRVVPTREHAATGRVR